MSMVELLVLGLIAEEPRHGYDILREFRGRGFSRWSRISEISVYKALDRLESRGFIEPMEVRSGKIPERRTFSLTDRGRERLADLVFGMLSSEEPIYHDFFLPLEFIGALPVEEASLALEKRLSFLEKQAEGISVILDATEEVDGTLSSLIMEHLLESYRNEIAWLRRVISELRTS